MTDLIALQAERDQLREALAERVPEIVENLRQGGGAAAAWAGAIEAERDRLRERVHYAEGTADANIARANEAEAERDRLREALEKAQGGVTDYAKQYVALRAENDRLREALDAMVGDWGLGDWKKLQALRAENDRLREALLEVTKRVEELEAALTELLAYIRSPVRMTKDDDEAARRAKLIERARATLGGTNG